MATGSLRLQITLFFGSILNNSLSFVVAFLTTLIIIKYIIKDNQEELLKANFYHLFKSASCRSANFSWFLCTGCNGCELLDILLGDITNFLGPLGALGVGGVA